MMDEHCRGCIRYMKSCSGMSKRLCEKHKLRIPITNADKIRAMSDEELAIWTAHISKCTWCPAKKIKTASPCKGLYSGCKGNWLDWLKQEAE